MRGHTLFSTFLLITLLSDGVLDVSSSPEHGSISHRPMFSIRLKLKRHKRPSLYYNNSTASFRCPLIGDLVFKLNPGPINQPIPTIKSSRFDLGCKPMSKARNPNNLVTIQRLPLKATNARHMSMCLLNARSINNKALFIKDYVVDNQIDILGITETWTKSDGQSNCVVNELSPRGYAFIHVPRTKRSGGGVGLLYNKCLKIERILSTKYSSFEHLEVNVNTPDAVLRVAVVYRPPPSKVNKFTASQFLQDFNDLLEHFSVTSGRLLLMGDFNFHVNEPSRDRMAAKFLDMLDSYNLVQHVKEATHKRKGTLDLLITRASEDTVLDCKVDDPDLSDHYAVHSRLKLTKPIASKVELTYRKLRCVDIEKFRDELSTLPIFTSPASNVDALLDQYQSNLAGLVDSHAPLKKRLVTLRPSAPWYNDNIASAKRERRKYERRWRKSGLTIHQELYKDQCKIVRSLIKSSKMEFYANLITENKSDHKVLFSAIDRMLNLKPEKSYPTCDSSTQLCNNFVDFFSEKIATIRNDLDSIQLPDTALFKFNHLDNPTLIC